MAKFLPLFVLSTWHLRPVKRKLLAIGLLPGQERRPQWGGRVSTLAVRSPMMQELGKQDVRFAKVRLISSLTMSYS